MRGPIRYPDAGKEVLFHQFQHKASVALIGPLLPRAGGADLAGRDFRAMDKANTLTGQ